MNINKDLVIEKVTENTFEMYVSGYQDFKKRITTLQLVEIIKQITKK